MKKIISLLLVAVMVLSMSVVAFADDEYDLPVSVDLYADVEKEDAVAYTQPAYKFTLSYNYDKPTITVPGGEKYYVWDTENLRYYLNDENGGGEVTGELELTATLTNYSNMEITALININMPDATGYESMIPDEPLDCLPATVADSDPLFEESDKEGYLKFAMDPDYPAEYSSEEGKGEATTDTATITIDFSDLTFGEGFLMEGDDVHIGTVTFDIRDAYDSDVVLNRLINETLAED